MVDDQVSRVIEYGYVTYYNSDKQLHRVDGPAVAGPDGYEAWYLNDKCHRVDGPAVTWPNGAESWYRNDKLHREDGPAVLDVDGTEEYWVHGEQVGNEPTSRGV